MLTIQGTFREHSGNIWGTLGAHSTCRSTCRINSTPQALLEGISLSQPQPKIPAELIKFLGKTYNAWHISIPLLESHVLSRLFLKDSRCFHALADLYRHLSEVTVTIERRRP
jgi:hypothetical protein